MTYRETARLIGMRMSAAQHRACAYLERHGFRFCVEFGRDNAIDKAREHWRRRARGQR